jgi:nucleoside-diphosphate-sugar epimerase
MTRAESEPVLVTGSTGRIGRMVVDQLLDAGVSVRGAAIDLSCPFTDHEPRGGPAGAAVGRG